MRLFIGIVFVLGLFSAFTGCGKDDNTSNAAGDQPASTASNPTPTPAPSTPQNVDQPWDRVSIERSTSADNCEKVFEVLDAGGWIWHACGTDATSAGQLTPAEQAEVERRATAALNATQPAEVCNDLKMLDADYVEINGVNGQPPNRDFRPNGDCHSGGTQEVPALRSYLRSLRAKYTSDF